MKLKTKLIPLASIGAVCAAVTPLALTSCGNKNKWVDLMDMYIPDFDKVESTLDHPTTYNESQALKVWTDNIKNDPDKLIQENYWSESRDIQIVNSRAFINDYDPEKMLWDISEVNPGRVKEVAAEVVDEPVGPIRSNVNANFNFFNVTNRTRYSTYKEKMYDVSVSTQTLRFTVGSETLRGVPIKWEIPTISFTIEYKRSYDMSYYGSVLKYKYSNLATVERFDTNATRTSEGKLVVKDVPLLIVDLNDTSKQRCWTVVPFIQWGCENEAADISYNDWLEEWTQTTVDDETTYVSLTDGITDEEQTLYPKAWTITSEFTNKQEGSYLSETNQFDLNFTSSTKEDLSSSSMIKDFENITEFATYDYIIDSGFFNPWYIFNTKYDFDQPQNWFWDMDFFWKR